MTKKPLSEAQLAANRANAKKSTGPVSIEGKKRSSANSTTHGITARRPLLPWDECEVYENFIAALVDDLRPSGNLELEISRNVAEAYWRLRSLRSVEEAMLTLPPELLNPRDPSCDPTTTYPWNPNTPESLLPPRPKPEEPLLIAARVVLHRSQSFSNLSLYEQRIQRGIKTSMQELRRLQSDRKALVEREMPIAINHYKFNLMQDLPFDPAADGFVFSLDEINDALYLDLRKKRVEHAVSVEFDLPKYEKRYPKRAA